MSTVNIAPDVYRLPEQGELVEVRRRQWLVSDVDECKPEGDGYRVQHLVMLESIEEDATGAQISVIWEIEPGARILDRAGLPEMTGYDSNERLDAFLHAINWGLSTNVSHNALLSPFRSGIAIEDYQLDPLVRALAMARVNLLIADDTGLGKTVEAGLVVQELLIRHRARTVLIVAPASDLTNWQREMLEKFGLKFNIIDSAFVRDFRRNRGIQANPWTSFPFLIASMDWIKQGEGLRLLKEALPVDLQFPRKFDILIVDEAHNVAPSGSGNYAKASQRTRVIQRLAPHFTHHLFLSATPHNGYEESFYALLELLDNQRFARTVPPSAEQMQQVMVRRLKRDIVDEKGNPVFPKRELLPLEIDYTDDERHVHELLRRFMSLRLAAASAGGRHLGTAFVLMLLKKRLFSSPAAFSKTLEKFRASLAQGRVHTVSKQDERSLYDAIKAAEEDAADEKEVEEAEDEVIERNARLTAALSPEENRILDELVAWSRLNESRTDSKARAILAWLDGHLKNPDGSFNDERVILFTEFMDTHGWMKTILAHHGYGGNRIMELHGSLDRESRDTVINAFQASPSVSPVRILLATDAASEGINLHNHCRYLIHLEIPWNPNVMEQRNGRIDRHGQKSKSVYIWHPVGKGFKADENAELNPGDIEGDGEYLLRAARKVDAIRQDLGSVGSVLFSQIQDAMLGRGKRLDADVQKLRTDRARRVLALERDLKAQIGKLHGDLLASRAATEITPENVQKAVATALALAGKPPLTPAHIDGIPDGKLWKVPHFNDSWSEALVGLPHPHTKVERPITFDDQVSRNRDDVVLAHLNHPLVRLSLRLLREEIWRTSGRSRLHRVSIRSVAGLAQPMVYVWSRLLIVGGDNLRLHEELIYSGGEIKDASFRREETLSRLTDLMTRSQAVDQVSDTVFAILSRRFTKFRDDIVRAYEVRSKTRQESLSRRLEENKTREQKDVNALLDELERKIRGELADEDVGPKLVQETFAFMTEDEKEEVKRDFAALHARLDQIPEERKRELEMIDRHYANPRALTFPAAVQFLIPENWRMN